MRFIKRFLVVEKQSVVMLDNGKPCRHCRKRQTMPLADHLASWEIPHALIIYAGEDVDAICLDCLKEMLDAD